MNKQILLLAAKITKIDWPAEYHVNIKGIESLADHQDIIKACNNVINNLYLDGLININYDINLFEILLTPNKHIIYGSDQRANIFELYSKHFNVLTKEIQDALLEINAKNNSNTFM